MGLEQHCRFAENNLMSLPDSLKLYTKKNEKELPDAYEKAQEHA